MADFSSFYPPNDPPKDGSELLTFDMVIERLLEAWGFLRRMPDREAGWLHSAGVASVYHGQPMTLREVQRAFGIEAAVEVAKAAAAATPRLPGLRSAEVDRMNAVFGLDGRTGWIEAVEPRDRVLVGLVLQQLDRGAARPSWRRLARDLGWSGHPDTLAKRWERAVRAIAFRVNA